MGKMKNTYSQDRCPCCNKTLLYDYDICAVCGWQNDPIQNDHPDMRGGANKESQY